jgi:hypothetical protein
MGPSHSDIKNLCFSTEMEALAFKMGVAHSYGLLDEEILKRWYYYLSTEMPLIHFGDTLLSSEYKDIGMFLMKMEKLIAEGGEAGLTKEMVESAEKGKGKRLERNDLVRCGLMVDVRCPQGGVESSEKV